MSINLSMKKIVVVLVLGLIAYGSFWWFVSTKEKRQVAAQYKQFVTFAERQEIEITIIRQTMELQQLKAEFQKSQQTPSLPQQRTIIPSSAIDSTENK